MQGHTRIFPDTRYRTFDFPANNGKGTVTGVEFDGLTLAVGLHDDDEKMMALASLIVALQELREAARQRLMVTA